MTKSPLAVYSEYFALRLFCAGINAVPYPLAMAFARGLARLAFSVFRFKRRRTLGRIRSVFPDKPEREVREIALRSLQNVLQTAVEMMRASRLDRAWMDRHVEDGMRCKEILQQLVDEGRGVVIMLPHSGNWYMGAWAMVRYGLPLFAIGSRQRNPRIDAWMRRQYGDVEILDRDCRDTLLRIHEKLAAGRAFAILPDLRVRHPDVAAEFLGGTANVSRSGAAFAVRRGCPIMVAAVARRNGRHVFRHLATLRPDPAAPDRKEEARRLTREALRLMSDEVMRNPGDWYWYNKRWILEPV